jgi:hypothetical protein
MQPGEWLHGGRGGKLTEAIGELQRQAYRYLKDGKTFTNPSLWDVFDCWACSKRGIPPAPGCYGEMNPNLLDAFAVLDATALRVERETDVERLKALAMILLKAR